MIRFKTFRYSLGILIISAALCGFWQRANAQIVEIPDPNLESAIREALQLPDSVPITQLEMLRLRDLEAGQREITDLTGLEFASNLFGLYVGGNWTVNSSSSASSLDLSPLLSLTESENCLLVNHCRISDYDSPCQADSVEKFDSRRKWDSRYNPIGRTGKLGRG